MASILVVTAFVVLTLVIILFVVFQPSLSLASQRRMMGMMARYRLIGRFGNKQLKATIKEARRRCKECKHEDLCDRWLAGEVASSNSFCPNAQTFEALASADERVD